jgi:uncharacterized protein (TIGR03086 family)
MINPSVLIERSIYMSEPEVFILAEQALKNAIDQIKDDQWGQITPDSMSRGTDVSLRALVNYHAYDDSWVPEVLAGKTIEEVGDKYDGDLLGNDPKASYAKITADAQRAVQNITDLDKVVHLSYGDFAAREYLKHITSFRGLRAWSISRFIGINTKLPADLVQGMWDEIIPQVDQWRAMGVFGPAIAVPEDADQQTKLLAITGFYKPAV